MEELNEIEKEIFNICINKNIIPSKKNIKDIYGKSYSSILRLSVSLSKIVKQLPKIKESKLCANCGKEITSKSAKKFCCRSCSAVYNNTHYDTKYVTRKVNTFLKHNKEIDSVQKDKIIKTIECKFCLFCGEKIKNKYKYCSVKCQHEYEYNNYINKWLSGDTSGLTLSKTVPTKIRKYLFIKYESKCSRCGWGEINPITGNTPLEVEHIDGDSTNNLEENLTLLCPNCHSLTPTYKALNKGNGRHSRRMRYREGKSY